MNNRQILKTGLIIIMGLTFLLGCITPRKGPKKMYDQAVQMTREKPFDAIIVPGIPFRNGSWDTVMKARVIWAWVLYKNGMTKNVIFSGDAVYSPYKEAIVMGLYAEQLGIPKEHIFYETRARHSTENIFYSYLLAKKLGFKSLALATDPFQSFLLKGFIKRRFASRIHRLPFVVDTLSAYNAVNPRIDPQPAYVDSFVPITSNETYIQRTRGTLGKDIDWSKYDKGQLPPL